MGDGVVRKIMSAMGYNSSDYRNLESQEVRSCVHIACFHLNPRFSIGYEDRRGLQVLCYEKEAQVIELFKKIYQNKIEEQKITSLYWAKDGSSLPNSLLNSN